MPLNYNKWDKLELSDDSDIEVHPNVDKKSMIRWKQRDIHEKREMRKLKLQHLDLEKAMNVSLLARMDALIDATKSEGDAYIEREVGRLRAAVPDFESRKFKDGEQPSEDHMVLSLLLQVAKAVKESDGKKTSAGELAEHRKRLADRQVDIEKEKVELAEEQKKFITSDDLHVGFESKTMISTKPSAAPAASSTPSSSSSKNKQKQKASETVIETLNSPTASTSSAPTAANNASDESEEEEEPAPLSDSAAAFAKLPSLDFPKAFAYISDHPDLLSDATVDALMVEGFSLAMKGKDKQAKLAIEKSQMIQYCLQLGRDGVALFFKRMTASDHRGLQLFLEDVRKTQDRIIARARVVAEEKKHEQEHGVETIQLVASDPNITITFEVPDGPPPEKIEITGEGSEDLDPVAVREFLQQRWEIFDAFPKNLKKALQKKSLEDVNKVLAKMAVDEAENVVKQLQDAGILSFDEGGIRDETGKAASGEAEHLVQQVD